MFILNSRILRYEKFTIITLSNAGRGGDGKERGGSKKSKPFPAPPRGAGLKSCHIPIPPPLRGKKNPHGTKWRRMS